jgi:ATP:cob(I)alamin adenosyltransferase
MVVRVGQKSVVTKKGDEGYTYAYSGYRLGKDDLRIETIGRMDELNAFLGMAKSLIKDKKGKDILERIQNDLFIMETQFSGEGSKRVKKHISPDDIVHLEDDIKRLEKKFRFTGFIIPGDNLLSSVLHVARTLARRVEHEMVFLRNKKISKGKNILIYLNRLSDLLFLLACRYSFKKSFAKL